MVVTASPTILATCTIVAGSLVEIEVTATWKSAPE
jgi:hypothetical protein